MNVLDYRTSDENGLSFALLVDGQPLGDLIGATEIEIPYWYFNDDLPPYPYWEEPDRRIVTVCSCGDDGCSHTDCRVIKEDAIVVFRDFVSDVSHEGRQKIFQFSRSNYDAVVAAIIREANEYAERKRNATATKKRK